MATDLVTKLDRQLARLEALPQHQTRAVMCELRISARCTNENGYDWDGKACCDHCLSMAERAMESQQEVPEEAQVRR